MFSSYSGFISMRLTHRGFPQGSCLSPLLFNIYISSISHSLISQNFQMLLYADDIVLFFSNNFLETSLNILSETLRSHSIAFSTIFFVTSPKKSSFMIFNRRQIKTYPHIVSGNQIIYSSSSITYLGLKFDHKLKWVLHFQYF